MFEFKYFIKKIDGRLWICGDFSKSPIIGSTFWACTTFFSQLQGAVRFLKMLSRKLVLPDVVCFLDDILATGKNDAELPNCCYDKKSVLF